MNCFILAFDPVEGAAFYKFGSEIYYVTRPHLDERSKVKSTMREVTLALHRHNFLKLDVEIPTEKALYVYLNDQFVQVNKKLGRNIDSASYQDVLKFLGNVPKNVLMATLEKKVAKLKENGDMVAIYEIISELVKKEKISLNDLPEETARAYGRAYVSAQMGIAKKRVAHNKGLVTQGKNMVSKSSGRYRV